MVARGWGGEEGGVPANRHRASVWPWPLTCKAVGASLQPSMLSKGSWGSGPGVGWMEESCIDRESETTLREAVGGEWGQRDGPDVLRGVQPLEEEEPSITHIQDWRGRGLGMLKPYPSGPSLMKGSQKMPLAPSRTHVGSQGFGGPGGLPYRPLCPLTLTIH